MNLRIQTYGKNEKYKFVRPLTRHNTDDVNVLEVLRKGLDDLTDLCDVVEDKFTKARDEFNAANPDRANPEGERS